MANEPKSATVTISLASLDKGDGRESEAVSEWLDQMEGKRITTGANQDHIKVIVGVPIDLDSGKADAVWPDLFDDE